MRLTFWGVRGSVATPNPENLGYGGNTSCIEITTPENERIIVDAGTGIRNLGRHLSEQSGSQSMAVHLFLTHFHWDHLQGLPFFSPLFQPGNNIAVYSFPPAEQICERLALQMSSPFFTVDFNDVGAARTFHQIEKSPIQLGNLSLTAFPLNHPQGACGYRIESRGASIVVATDVEHGHPELDKVLRQHAEGADILIYDAHYTAADYLEHQGWGHSTPTEAARVAADAGVKQLILFHHHPMHDDAKMDEIVNQTRGLFENCIAAREQHPITL
jgi:phosphoribosyl 1,2-cyclic phosphodiesterase